MGTNDYWLPKDCCPHSQCFSQLEAERQALKFRVAELEAEVERLNGALVEIERRLRTDTEPIRALVERHGGREAREAYKGAIYGACIHAQAFALRGEEAPDASTYPCAVCGAPRTEAEGGKIFTVCDKCVGKRILEAPDA